MHSPDFFQRPPATAAMLAAISSASFAIALPARAQVDPVIGREVAIPRHLADGEEYSMPLRALLEHGRCCSTPTGPSRKAAAGR